MTVHSAYRSPRLHLLALALALACTQLAAAKDADSPVCPVGVLKCPKPKKADEFALCKRNDLLDFYRPGLPTEGDRNQMPTDILARKISSTDSSHYRLEGDVEMQRLDELVRADAITYDSDSTAYDAQGHVRLQDSSMLMSADHARGTTNPRTSTLDNIRYQMLDDKRGNGVAATATMTDPDHGTMNDGTYSTCDPSDRRWYLHSDTLEMDKVENVGRAHDVTLYYADVPFFWFPYLKFPLSNERESGFLTPHLAYGNRRGLVIGEPYYLNLAPNYDATIEPRWSSNRGGMLEGQFRYLDATDKAQIDFNFVPRDGEVDDERAQYAAAPPTFQGPPSPLDLPQRRYAFRVQESTALSDNWQTAVDVNRVSDKQYFQDYGNSLVSTANTLLGSSAYLVGRGAWWTASIGGDAIQITQPYLSDAFTPYERLPRATFQGEHDLFGGFAYGASAEYVNFRKGPFDVIGGGGNILQFDSIEGQRIDVHPYLAYPIETAGYFVRPEIGVRYTAYDLSDLDGFAATHPGQAHLTDKSPSRTVPIFDLDAGLIFERPLTLFGTDLTQTLEPRLYYLRVPYRDQSDLPIFDTVLPALDFPALFRSNGYVGGDRQSNANNLTVALTSRLIDTVSGDEFLSASLGQIRYFEPQRVQFPGRPEVDFSGSDYVAELDLRLNDRWEFKWDQQYNPNGKIVDPLTRMLVENLHHTDLSAFSLEHRFGAEGAINFAYRFRRGLLEQVDTSALYPLNERWSLVGRYYYSLLDKRLLEAFAGAQYDSCCVAVRVLVRRYISSIGQVQANTGLYFELEFKGIGNTGSRTENFLRRAILGYD